jgi:hypothetical protein
MTNQTRLLELALKGLEAERSRIEAEIADLRGRMRTNGTGSRGAAQASSSAPRKRGRLSAAGRKAISDAMKRRWAARRKELGK